MAPAREERPWPGLVTCLLDFRRFQIHDTGEGRVSVKFVTALSRGASQNNNTWISSSEKTPQFRGSKTNVEWKSFTDAEENVYKSSSSENLNRLGT